MQVSSQALGVFVPGNWSVPQNPISGGMGHFVPGRFTLPEHVVGLAGFGEFVDGKFTVPENVVGLGNVGNIEGCGCGGRCGGCGGGMGDLSTMVNDAWTKIQSYQVFGVKGGYILMAVGATLLLVALSPKARARRRRNPAGGAFARCVKSVSARGGAYDPRAVCATSGRKKYGAAKFQQMAIAGKKRAKRK